MRKNNALNPYLLCLGLEFFALAAVQLPAQAESAQPTVAGAATVPVAPQPEMRPAPTQVAPTEIAKPETMVAPSAAVQPAAAPAAIAPVAPAVTAPTSVPTPVPTSVPTSTVQTPTSTEVKILTPTSGTVLDVPAATVMVQYPLGATLTLQVNGATVGSDLVGRTETNSEKRIVTQTFYGVALQEGSNRIVATTGAGSSEVEMQVRGAAKEIKVETLESRIPADGRSTATVKGQLIDPQGNRSNRDAVVTLSTTAGDFTGADADPDQPGFQVKAVQGQFTASLRAGLEAKSVTVKAIAGSLEGYTQIKFETNLRNSIATGVLDFRLGAKGTDYYRSFRDYLPTDKGNGTDLDVRSAAFTTGRIGEWLLTAAYNSERPLNQTCEGSTRLFRDQQFCDQTYPVYGDSSTSTVVAPSIDSIFARLERSSPVQGAGSDYVMWGDYNTEEFATRSQEFTATTRQLHGAKVNYNLGNLQISGLFADNVQGFQRDTVAPDGTSGYYLLSRRQLVEGSEDLALETEELNRPGTVIERKRLTRGNDYEIDYDRGAILFRKPMLRTDIGKDGATLVRRIVATYQYDTGKDSKNSIIAARARYHLSRQLGAESWLGASYLKEDRGARDFELYGADALISFGPNARLIGEYAHSNNVSETLGPVEGSAYRLELEGQITPKIQGRAYLRSADTGFANNATTSFVAGQTRYGGLVTAGLSSNTNLRFQYDHEDNQGLAPQVIKTYGDLLTPRSDALPGTPVDNSLTTISAGIQQRIGRADLTLDYLHRDRSDRINPQTLNATSDQIKTRLSLPLNNRLTLLAQNETTLSKQTDPIYGDRSLVGLNWQVMSGINLQLAQQFFHSGQLSGKSITSLNLGGDYNLSPDSIIHGRYSIISGLNDVNSQGLIGQGALGFEQKLRISPGLKVSLAYEHVFGRSLKTATGDQFTQPFAFGQSASALALQGGDSYSIGFDYTDSPAFNASARYEFRNGPSGSNTVISAAATGKLSPSLTALMRYQQANISNAALVGFGDTASLKIGLAYRDPRNDTFNALLRYEYRKNPALIPDSILIGTGTGSLEHLFAAEVIYAPSWRWELYSKFGVRNSKSYLADDLISKSTVTLAQLRATYRLNYSFDLVGEARWISQPTAGYSENGFLLEAGYYLTPNLRIAGGYSFGNVNRDRDFDGSRSASGPYLGVTLKLNDLFNGFGLQKVAPPQQQEAVIKATKPEVNATAQSAIKPESKSESKSESKPSGSPQATAPMVTMPTVTMPTSQPTLAKP